MYQYLLNQRQRRQNTQSGFTIAELLIITAIVGLLVTLIVIQYTHVQARNRDTQRKNDIQALQWKVESYYASTGKYPVNLAQISQLPESNCQAPRGHGTCTKPDYIYKAFKSGTTVSSKNTEDCDNKTNDCTGYIIYTNDMETQSGTFQLTSD